LEERFPQPKETQPELLAHHYTEAGLIEQAISYWQQAGKKATQRSAYTEAISHFTRGLELLQTLPDTLVRARQELTLQLAQGTALFAGKGLSAPEVEKTYLRARDLCQQLGETPQLFPVLHSLVTFYRNGGKVQTALELAKQCFSLAQSIQDQYLLSLAHEAIGWTLYFLGELPSARLHVEQTIALYDPHRHPRSPFFMYDPRVSCLSNASWNLWALGYPDQALQRSQEGMALAKGWPSPYSLATALGFAAWFHLFRRDGKLAQEQAEAVMTLSTEHGFPLWLAHGTITRVGALAQQGQVEECIVQMRQGLTAVQTEVARPFGLALLAKAYGKAGQPIEGIRVLVEALAFVDKTGVRYYEAELYRLKGELTLLQFKRQGSTLKVPDPQLLIPNPQGEAEACFFKAVDIARKQQAKSLELRAATSLARLWQQQGKRAEAHKLLSEVYNWFTEGFDTKDLQEAKALLEELVEKPKE
jgi:predicted ATPase